MLIKLFLHIFAKYFILYISLFGCFFSLFILIPCSDLTLFYVYLIDHITKSFLIFLN